jgi:hypothetical protein
MELQEALTGHADWLEHGFGVDDTTLTLLREAAAEIARLRAEVAELRTYRDDHEQCFESMDRMLADMSVESERLRAENERLMLIKERGPIQMIAALLLEHHDGKATISADTVREVRPDEQSILVESDPASGSVTFQVVNRTTPTPETSDDHR